MLEQEILIHLEQELSVYTDQETLIQQYHLIPGGDINVAFVLNTNRGNFFLKMNSNGTSDLFQKEYTGLKFLRAAESLYLPDAYRCSALGSHTFIFMEYLEKGEPAPDFWKNFGEQLAMQHRNSEKAFGFWEHNYIGTLPQRNSYCSTWREFYSAHRVLPMLQLALEQELCSLEDITLAEQMCQRLDELLPAEPPALLHGDLWNGNFMSKSDGQVAVFDPAVYYGHREMDIAMTQLFGGFDDAFYYFYNEVWPLEAGWKDRMDISQLYPLLVHLVLFGSGYYDRVRNILLRYGS